MGSERTVSALDDVLHASFWQCGNSFNLARDKSTSTCWQEASAFCQQHPPPPTHVPGSGKWIRYVEARGEACWSAASPPEFTFDGIVVLGRIFQAPDEGIGNSLTAQGVT